MTYVLFATSRFGALVLEGLVAAGFPPAAVVSNPDRPAGRRRVLTPTPAAEIAKLHNIRTFKPDDLREIHEELRQLHADCFVVASFGRILKPELVAIPPKGVVGIHPSLLPRYRGPAPIQQAVLDGVTETGVTLFKVDDVAVDHGPMIAVATLPVPPCEPNLVLEERLARLGAELAVRELPRYAAGEIVLKEQDHTAATFTHKFVTEDGHVLWSELVRAYGGDMALAHTLCQKIGGLDPEPGAWTEQDGRRIKLLAARVDEGGLRVTRYQKDGGVPVDEVLACA